MTVKEAVGLLAYGERFYLKGAYTGKILHKSYENKKEHLEKYLEETVTDSPFFTDLRTSKTGTPCAYPVIGIWVHDYKEGA